ncbi:hypothetical protein [Pseudonocardia sp. T1-2H]|uniref:hypothetical protein n=1 Tax=Pseudonocardia sp. T1-2H TaxID=3128899 RepID=UPI003100CB14
MPTFTTGSVPTAATFAQLTTGIDSLAQISVGLAAAYKPSAPAMSKSLVLTDTPIPDATDTVVRWGGTAVDTDNMLYLLRDTELTVHQAGWYRIEGQAAWQPGPASQRAIYIAINGTAASNYVAASNTFSAANNNLRQQVVAFEHLAAGSHIYMTAFQNSGGDLNLTTAANWGTWLSIAWEAPY